MFIRPWFHIDTPYSENGIKVTFFNQQLHLSSGDICYLLREINVLASHPITSFQTITFELHGFIFKVTDEEWLEFIDIFASSLFKSGWNSNCCEPYPEWLEDITRNQKL